MRTCRDIMTTDPVWCLPTDRARIAARLMKREDLGFLPVVKDRHDRKLIGVVTDRDLVLNVVAEQRPPETTPVADIMTARPITCHPDDPLDRALASMAQHQVRRIPIIDDAGVVIGIVALADVALQIEERAMTSEVLTRISKPTPVHPSMATTRWAKS